MKYTCCTSLPGAKQKTHEQEGNGMERRRFEGGASDFFCTDAKKIGETTTQLIVKNERGSSSSKIEKKHRLWIEGEDT